jgi:hypothetical protein
MSNCANNNIQTAKPLCDRQFGAPVFPFSDTRSANSTSDARRHRGRGDAGLCDNSRAVVSFGPIFTYRQCDNPKPGFIPMEVFDALLGSSGEAMV